MNNPTDVTKQANDCARAIVGMVEKEYGIEMTLDHSMRIVQVLFALLETCTPAVPGSGVERELREALELCANTLDSIKSAQSGMSINYALAKAQEALYCIPSPSPDAGGGK
jgi:hypothetical protein